MKIFTFILASFSIIVPSLVSAHGFGQRIDLPLPLNLYLIGAGIAVAISFVLIGFIRHKGEHLDHYPRYNLLQVSWIRSILENKLFLIISKTLFVLILVLVVVAGIYGTQSTAFNIAPTFVWILFGVGLTYFAALIGNIWEFINPFKTLYEWTDKLLGKFSLERPWPRTWGIWPALLGFLVYRWVENVYPDASVPSSLAILVLIYLVVTFFGMLYFGKDTWLRYGDPFSVFFRFLSRFSITEWRLVEGRKELNLRPLAVGLFNQDEKIDTSIVAFVLFMLASVSFDGVKVTPLWSDLTNMLSQVGFSSIVANTLGLLLLFAVFILIYLVFSSFVRFFSRSQESILTQARTFIFSLLPIAIAYEIAHFVTLLFIDGQRTIPLLSDPFGIGWNLFGTADYTLNYQLINLKILWNLQVALIILGHIVAVYIAHIIALHFFQDRKVAIRSQYPMLVLMVSYTMLGLWILAQPIVVGLE